MKNDVIHLAKSVKLIRVGKNEGGELKDPTKRAAFASLFTPREANLPATVVSPAPAPATPEDNTALANRSPSSGPASAESPDLIAKATQTLMEAPVTRRKFLETSRNAVAAAKQAPTISKLLKPTKIAEKIRPDNISTIQNSLEEMFNHFEESGYDPSDPYEMMRDALSGYMKNNPDKPTLKNVKAAIDELHDPETWLKSYYDHMDLTPEEINHLSDNEHLQQLLDYHSENVLPDYGRHEWSELKDTAKEAMENPDIKKSEGGELELRRAKMAKERAGGQLLPSSEFMPNVPRQVRAEGGLIHKESGGRISREQQLFIDYLKKHYPDGIILHHETPGHEGQSIRKNKLQGSYGVFAAIDAPSNFVTSKNKTTTKFRVPASHYENISPDMGYGGDDDGSTHNDPFIDFMNKHPNPKGAYVGTSYEEIPDRWVKEIKETHDDGPKYFSDGGDVAPEINNPMSVFPKPQRMFPEDDRPAGGQYLSMPDKADMTGHKSAAASIGIGSNGKPYFNASKDAVDETGTSGKGNAVAKTNLFKQKAGWKWKDAPEGHESTSTIVSVEHRGKHYYALNAHFPKGVDLARYENSPSEPRLRPTTRGNVDLGPEAGSILVRGKEHPVYQHVIVKADGGRVHKEGGGGLAARRAEAQAYIKELIEQRNQYKKGSPDYDFYTKQIAEQGKIVAQKTEAPPQKVVTPGAGHNNPPEEPRMRRTNALGVYSHAAEVARNAKQEAMPPEDWVKFLKNQQGVKEDELTWAKVADMTPALGKKTVSKNDVAQRLDNANLDDYEEVVRDNRYLRDPNTNEKIDPDSARHLIASEAVKNPALLEKIFGDATESVNAELSDLNDDFIDQGYHRENIDKQLADHLYNVYRTGPLRTYLKSTQANHEGYTLKGSGNNKNYREIIAQWKPEKKLFQYDTHYSDYNPLFHLRLADVFKPTPPMSDDEVKNLYFKSFGIAPIDNDEWSTKSIGPGMLHHVKNKIPQEDFDRLHSWWRQNYPNDNQFGPAPGKKYLHAEEVQGDWGQKGRGRFSDPEALEKAKAAYQAAVKEAEEATDKFGKWKRAARKNLEIAHGVTNELYQTDSEEYRRRDRQADEAWYKLVDSDYFNTEGAAFYNAVKKFNYEQYRLENEYYNLKNNSVPAGPHVTDTKKWTDLAAKRLLKEMADGNYNGIVLSNGNIQSNRWSGQPGVKEYYDEKLEPTLDRMMKMHDPKAGKTSENFEIPVQGARQRSMQTHAEVADAMGVDAPQNDTERNALVQAWADLPSATRNRMENDWRARNQSALSAHQLPIFESTPQANASIPNNQKSWKRGGAVIPHDDPQREKNLAAWHKDSHPSTKNEDGTPKTFYHGTQADFSTFRTTKTGEFGPGIYATDNPDEAADYAGTHPFSGKGPSVMPIYIRMKNPFIVGNHADEFWNKFSGKTDEDALFNVMAAGHDGVIFKRPYSFYDEKTKQIVKTGQDHTHYVAFSPNQIKSATGNNGDFNPSKPNINEARGGRIGYDYGGDVRTGDNPGGLADANRPAATSSDADRNYNAGSGTQYDNTADRVMDRVQRDAGKEGASDLQKQIANDFLNVAGAMKNNQVAPQEENMEELRANYLMYRPSKITQPQNLISPNDQTIVGGFKFENRVPSINEPIKEFSPADFSMDRIRQRQENYIPQDQNPIGGMSFNPSLPVNLQPQPQPQPQSPPQSQNQNNKTNIPLPPQRGDDSYFGNMGGNIGSVLGGIALGPIGAVGGRYLGNQFNQPDNSRFEAKNDEFGNPVGNSVGWLDFLGTSGNPPPPMTSDNRRDPIVKPRKPRRRVLMPDGTYQEVEEYKSGGEVKSPIAKKIKTEHNSPIVEVALSKIRSLPRGSDYPSRGMRGRP